MGFGAQLCTAVLLRFHEMVVLRLQLCELGENEVLFRIPLAWL